MEAWWVRGTVEEHLQVRVGIELEACGMRKGLSPAALELRSAHNI